jgi:hypothetical protein
LSDKGQADGTGRGRASFWVLVLLGLAAAAAIGFAIWWWLSDLRRSDVLDDRRFHELAIAADSLATWPETARQLAWTNLYRDTGDQPPESEAGKFKQWVSHPELGEFSITYSFDTATQADEPACKRELRVAGNNLTVGGVLLDPRKLSGDLVKPTSEQSLTTRIMRRDLDATHIAQFSPSRYETPICFEIGPLDLGKVVPLPRHFKHLLLVRTQDKKDKDDKIAVPSGEVIAQLGRTELPVRNIDALPKLSERLDGALFAQAVASNLGKAKAGGLGPLTSKAANDALMPINSRVAAEDFRFYLRPITMAVKGDGGALKEEYMLVGAAPQKAERSDVEGAGGRLIFYGVALAFALALVPIVKLSLIGPVDTLRPIDVVAIAVGLIVAVAMASALWVGARDTYAANDAAYRRLSGQVGYIAESVQRELDRAIASSRAQTAAFLESEEADRLKRAATGQMADPSVLHRERIPATNDLQVYTPDSIVILDHMGRLALNTASRSRRDDTGTNTIVTDRPYFRRALQGDFTEAAPDARTVTINGVPYKLGGYVVDEVRSRADSISKTIVGTKLIPLVVDPKRLPSLDKPAVISTSFVLQNMLAPYHAESVRFAVIDAKDLDRPVLFHSDPGRVHVERLRAGLDQPAREQIEEIARRKPECAAKSQGLAQTVADRARTFAGDYEGVHTLFAASYIPCTDWIAIAFTPQDSPEIVGWTPVLHAMALWLFALIAVVLIWAAIAALIGTKSWRWLWPDPRLGKQRVYRQLARSLAFSAIFAACAVRLDFPRLGLLIGILATAGAIAMLIIEEARTVRDSWREKAEHRAPHTLTRATELPFAMMVILLLVNAVTIPVFGLTGDARLYFADRAAHVFRVDYARAQRDEAVATDHILKAFSTQRARIGAQSSAAAGPVTGPAKAPAQPGHACSASGSDAGWFAPYQACRDSLTASLRKVAKLDQDDDFAGAASSQASRPLPDSMQPLIEPIIGDPDKGKALVPLALLFAAVAALLWMALRTVLPGLFGFRVPLQAVEHPALPAAWQQPLQGDWPLHLLPQTAIVISPPAQAEQNLRACAGATGEVIDLFEVTADAGINFIPSAGRGEQLYLFTNIELVLRDHCRRQHALTIMEDCLAAQAECGYRIALITELAPLDRLLHTSERDAEELGNLAPDERSAEMRERARHREDVRWSRLFECFAIYIYPAQFWGQEDLAFPEVGTTLRETVATMFGIDLGRETAAPAPLARTQEAQLALRTAWAELQFQPDHALAPVIGCRPEEVSRAKIAEWIISCDFARYSPASVIDFLTSMLIEHYHFEWSISSRAEKLLLLRYASGQFANISKANAVRTLVRRGLLRFDPHPRIINKSFAQFVLQAEKQETFDRWRKESVGGRWRVLRGPIGIAVVVVLGVLIFTGLRNGEGLAALLPLLVAAGPALLNVTGVFRR